MKTQDFFFDVPPEYIAQFPAETRGKSRLLVLERHTGAYCHHQIADLPVLIEPGSLLVFNDSRVRPSRLLGVDSAQRPVELLLLEQIHDDGITNCWKALVKQRRRHTGKQLFFPEGLCAEIIGLEDEWCRVVFDRKLEDQWLERCAHIPLPPYIKRPATYEDSNRYQTIYAEKTGSAAAPTAGLHFTSELMDAFAARNIQTAFLTLHVGLGTFLPVRVNNIEDHKMHKEHFNISESTAEQFEAAKREKRPVVAVGTTTLRALESAWNGTRLQRGDNSTSIFIYGDYHFTTADMLFTNFHTPESTLLMLAASFCGAFCGAEAGRTMILNAYQTAQAAHYRFFSYGDAMLIR
ncbi:MAG: tRNA preQ1(34) S-adenosylmethionine ribosyltransferase-isomerase QueA [Spirochaetaceae bacterium]|jgi:S-adenosylmethionine:tRNA ribosyltransferase-isomerase|nr:tRNA preQ1(34) S-adenosylmethionine ribosyltransferase-isomerase QueA [Spirochaetaceae bacterium]